jgi:rhamnulokinase
MKLLAMDLGASSGRAMQGDLRGEALSLSEVHRFTNEPIEKDGHKHWDLDRLHRELLTALNHADPDVESVGIDTWGVDYGYVGPDGEVIGLPFAYRDERTVPRVDAVHERIPFDRLYAITGIQFMRINTVYQVADDAANRPDVLDAAERLLMMPELLSYLLTGEYAAEYSIASTSALLDARARAWSDEVLDAVGVPRRLFCGVSPPGAFRAELRPELGRRAALICPGCHDTASAVAACPLQGPDAMYISSGTWSLVGMELPEPILTDAARNANFTNEGGVAGTVRFLKNVMGLWIIQACRRRWAEAGTELGFGDICDRAEAAPPFAALIDPNAERFLAPQDMVAEVGAECERTGQPAPEGVGSTARCVFESLALAYRECLETLRELTGRRIDRIHVVGGGVQNALLCQMTANACGVPVSAGPVEATAVGNLLVQALALGAVADLPAARAIVRRTFPVEEYSPEDPAAWAAARERYRALDE